MEKQMRSSPNFDLLVQKFNSPCVKAIVLMGSYACGTAGPFSDIDLVRFIDDGKIEPSVVDGSYLIDDFLVTVSSVNSQQIEEWFSRPELAVNVISGIRAAHPLLDRSNMYESVQNRARAFMWTAEMQQKANRWASQQMVGWIEEVHKGLEGLRSKDIGRMLNSRFGCSWGLSKIMAVYKNLLLTGDNSFYDEVGQAVGGDSEWVQLRRIAFGIEDKGGKAPSLQEQVVAGLRLYVATSKLINLILEPPDVTLVEQTVILIESELGG
jgi:predicted nucleotidyltransferase